MLPGGLSKSTSASSANKQPGRQDMTDIPLHVDVEAAEVSLKATSKKVQFLSMTELTRWTIFAARVH
jgi:hypothetical protein